MYSYCFKHDCELEAQYACLCLHSETYFCESHIEAHFKFSNRAHFFHSLLAEPQEWNKTAVLQFLIKEKYKKKELKKIALASIHQNYYIFIEESLREVDSDLKEIKSLIEKVSAASDNQEDQLLNQLIVNPGTGAESAKATLGNNLDIYNSVRLYIKSRELRNKTYEIWKRVNNEDKVEQNFRRTCLLYKIDSSDSLLCKAYQEYINAYQKIASVYLCCKKNIFVYDTESGNEEMKTLELDKFPEFKRRLEDYYMLAPLPNGELFFIGRDLNCIIDRNFQARKLPPGIPNRCLTAIYFNNSVYCFGYCNNIYGFQEPFRKFDLNENRWIELAQSQEVNNNQRATSTVFKGNILISGWENSNILLYSIEIDSISKIPYEFTKKECKVIITAEERLYLIERKKWIYESEVGNAYSWKQIGESMKALDTPKQVYCSFNKGGIYISFLNGRKSREYYKFDLSQKTIIEIACYGKYASLQREGANLKTIKCNSQTFNPDSDHIATFVNKGYHLCDIVDIFKELELCNRSIRNNPEYCNSYFIKGQILHQFGYNFEALECYDKTIKLNSYTPNHFYYRARLLYDLGRDTEVIQDIVIGLDLSSEFDNNDNKILIQELSKMIYKLQENSVEYKVELEKIKDVSLKNERTTKEVDGKEALVKDLHSKILKRLTDCLTSKAGDLIIDMQQLKEKILEHQKTIIDIVAQFRELYLCIF